MLITRPECKANVSDHATGCPHCVYPLDKRSTRSLKYATAVTASTLAGASRSAWRAVRKLGRFAWAFLGYAAIWSTCFLLLKYSSRTPVETIVFRLPVNLVIVAASRIWILAAARIWPKHGATYAKVLFSIGFLIGTLAEATQMHQATNSTTVMWFSIIFRLAGYPLAIVGIRRQPNPATTAP